MFFRWRRFSGSSHALTNPAVSGSILPICTGRVYLNNGSLALATVGSDEDLRRQLIGTHLVGEEALRSAEIGGKSLNDVASDNGDNQALERFLP